MSQAIVSGVNSIEHPQSIVSLSCLGVLSPDGQCFSYDGKANGFGRGEGVGTVVIKPLRKALEDGNQVRAVIRATGSNQDGKTAGITLPNHIAQQRLIEDVYLSANLDPSLTSYVESHGTGTPVGDPLELKAISSALLGNRKTPLYVGSVKSVIGHLEGGAGVAGLIAAILAVESGKIPPLANFRSLNPSIPTMENLLFARDTIQWPREDIRRASINSFGYGGTNVHVVIEDLEGFLQMHPDFESQVSRHGQPEIPDFSHMNGSVRDPIDKPYQNFLHNGNGLPGDAPMASNTVYLISAFDEQGVQRNADQLLAHLKSVSFEGIPDKEKEFLSVLRYTLNSKRTQFDWRGWVVAHNLETLRSSLEKRLPVMKRSTAPRTIRFIFTGQGASWIGMGSDLLLYPVFRQRIEEASAYLKGMGSGWDLNGRCTAWPMCCGDKC